MRINLTKKDLVNVIYMQVGFSKQITENLVEEFFSIIVCIVLHPILAFSTTRRALLYSVAIAVNILPKSLVLTCHLYSPTWVADSTSKI